MAESTATRVCKECEDEKPFIPSEWHGRLCRPCDVRLKRERNNARKKHTPGRRRNWRQRAEIAAVLTGNSSWVTCTSCGLMQTYRPKANGKGGRGWRNLKCPKCVSVKGKERREVLKAQPTRSGPCSVCGQEGEYREGRRCVNCVRQWRNAYMRGRNRALPVPPKYIPNREEYKACGSCKKRKVYIDGRGWYGTTCGDCRKRFRRKAEANRKAKIAEWRATAAPVQCQKCGAVKLYGKGWSYETCDTCTRAYSQAQRDKVK